MPCPPAGVSFYSEIYGFCQNKIVLSASVGAFCFVRKDTCAVWPGLKRVYSRRFHT